MLLAVLIVQTLNQLYQSLNLTNQASANVAWTYAPPPVISVSVMPAGGCSDGSATCQTAGSYCSTGGSNLVSDNRSCSQP